MTPLSYVYVFQTFSSNYQTSVTMQLHCFLVALVKYKSLVNININIILLSVVNIVYFIHMVMLGYFNQIYAIYFGLSLIIYLREPYINMSPTFTHLWSAIAWFSCGSSWLQLLILMHFNMRTECQ